MVAPSPQPGGPFLKWAGGKGRLVPALVRIHEELAPSGGYHEPFLGGGALFFRLAGEGKLAGRQIHLSDRNGLLVETYEVVRTDPDALLALLEGHEAAHSREHYLAVRATVPEDRTARAARFIYLNRTCFNGLYRENARGLFNVPMGRYRNPSIADEARIRNASRLLSGCQVNHESFEQVVGRVAPGDFVYLDPPYHPVSSTSSFTRYVGEDFGLEGQLRVRRVFDDLDARGAIVLLSNSDTPFIRELFESRFVARVEMPRPINARTGGRGLVGEVLVCNRPLPPVVQDSSPPRA